MTEKSAKLAGGSMGAVESAIMGIGCTAPAFSVAVTTATIVGDVGALAVASVIYSGLIMLGLVFAFSNLNRKSASAGATYSWVSEIFSPLLGFVAGWSMLLASVVFMVAATIPAATSTLLLLAPSLVDDTQVVALVAAGWLTLITALVIRGIKNAYRAQLVMTSVEVAIIVTLVAGALWHFSASPAHIPQLSWISPLSFSPQSFVAGAITAIFFYWGWDVTMTLGEETREGEAGAGAFWAVLNLLIFFSIMMAIVLIVLSDQEIAAASSNVLFAVAGKLFPAPWSYIAVLCTMLSTIGTIEGQILQFSRCAFAMSRDGVLPPKLSDVHAKWQTPWLATLAIWGLGMILIFSSSYLPSVGAILKSSIAAIGLQICLYMGLAALASCWHYRAKLFGNVGDALTHVVWPLLGALGMFGIGVMSIPTLDRVALAVGFGGIALGALVFLLLQGARRANARSGSSF